MCKWGNGERGTEYAEGLAEGDKKGDRGLLSAAGEGKMLFHQGGGEGQRQETDS